MTDFTAYTPIDASETCDCDFVKRHPDHRSSEASTYLRELAERVDRGEIRHVSVSAHPIETDV